MAWMPRDEGILPNPLFHQEQRHQPGLPVQEQFHHEQKYQPLPVQEQFQQEQKYQPLPVQEQFQQEQKYQPLPVQEHFQQEQSYQPAPEQFHPEQRYQPAPEQFHPEQRYQPAPEQFHPEQRYQPAPEQFHPEQTYQPAPEQFHPEQKYQPLPVPEQPQPQQRSRPEQKVNVKKLPDWSIKRIKIPFSENEEFLSIVRPFFDWASEEVFLAHRFCYVHFNDYCRSRYGTFCPAEFCCVDWNLEKGILWFGGSPIDPGWENLGDPHIIAASCQKLELPRPPYTYYRGATYSVGEDRYEEIAKFIAEHSTSFAVPNNPHSSRYRYIFASEESKECVAGCMSWLMAQFGGDLPIRVLPLERFFGELLRSCQLRKFSVDLKAEITRQMEVTVLNVGVGAENDVKPQPCGTCTWDNTAPLQPRPVQRQAIDPAADPSENEFALKLFANLQYIANLLHESLIPGINYRIRLGCLWHQREATCGSVRYCSTLLCRKWVFLTLQKALDILDRDFEAHAQEMEQPDMKPTVWTENEAMGVEARQRFGFFGKISDKRTKILEEGFIFGGLLNELKRRMPDGLKEKPKCVIWPLDRDIEADLNWSPMAPFYIHDPDPQGRAERLEELKILRQKRILFEQSRDDDFDWSALATLYP